VIYGAPPGTAGRGSLGRLLMRLPSAPAARLDAARYALQFACIDRPSCMSGEYCPLRENVEPPKLANQIEARTHIPHFLTINKHGWKLRSRELNASQELYPIRVWRNPYRADLCPVVRLLVWLRMTAHIKKGPLFPELELATLKLSSPELRKAKRQAKERGEPWKRPRSVRVVPMSVNSWRSTFKRIAQRAAAMAWDNNDVRAYHRLRICTAQSVRRSAAQAYARVGRADTLIRTQIKLVGRWKSAIVDHYVDAGTQATDEDNEDGSDLQALQKLLTYRRMVFTKGLDVTRRL